MEVDCTKALRFLEDCKARHGIAPSMGQLVGKGDLAAQTRQVFANLETALTAAGATFNDVVKTNYYMLDASQVQVVREIRSKYFTSQLPASTLVEVRRLANPAPFDTPAARAFHRPRLVRRTAGGSA